MSIQLATAASCGGSPGLVTALTEGRLDLAFVSIPGPAPARVCLRELTSTPLDLVIPRDHHLADRSEIAISELVGESFIDFPRGYGNRAVTDRAFTAAGIQHHVTIEITDIAAGTDFIRQQLGVALLPRTVIPADDDLTTLRLTGTNLDWPISLATPTARTLGAAARVFERLIDQYLGELDRSRVRTLPRDIRGSPFRTP